MYLLLIFQVKIINGNLKNYLKIEKRNGIESIKFQQRTVQIQPIYGTVTLNLFVSSVNMKFMGSVC